MVLRQAWIAAGIILLGMAIMTAVAWPLMPPGEMIPIHFRLDGTPNRFAPREFGLLALPGLGLLVSFVLGARAARNDLGGFVPLAERSAPLSWVVMLAAFAGGQALIIGYAIHATPNLWRFFFGAIGVLIVVLGAAMIRVEPNAVIGIRTPWTRADRSVWQATHRFGSIVFIAAGTFIVGTAVFTPNPASLAIVALVVVIVAALICTLYSYLASRSLPAGRQPG